LRKGRWFVEVVVIVVAFCAVVVVALLKKQYVRAGLTARRGELSVSAELEAGSRQSADHESSPRSGTHSWQDKASEYRKAA
jgi:hypothetical protein